MNPRSHPSLDDEDTDRDIMAKRKPRQPDEDTARALEQIQDRLEQLTPPAGTRIQSDPASEITEKTRFSWPVVVAIVTLTAGVVTNAALSRAAGQDAGTARIATEEHEKRLTILEEQRKADARLLEKVSTALDENTRTLQAVQIELARKR